MIKYKMEKGATTLKQDKSNSFSKPTFQIIHLSHTTVIGGGDRIIIECMKRWKDKHKIDVLTSDEGRALLAQYDLNDLNFVVIPSARNFGNLYLEYLWRLFSGILSVNRNLVNDCDIVYSSSEFWPDSIPALLAKIRKPSIKWIAGFYIFAPFPFQKNTPYKGKRWLRNIIYYFSQLPIYILINRYADMIWVTNDIDRERFCRNFCHSNVITVQGGVDMKASLAVPEQKKIFDAVFIGRFHPQKGVLELIDIWRIVCKQKPEAKLAIIGKGDLGKQIREKIEKYKLEKNVFLLGFLDGLEKITIIKQSKVVLHPATYDSGGMAACEAMACGLPGVSFDLPALRLYYAKGMLKTPCFNLEMFAANILKLLSDENLWNKVADDAYQWASSWDWGNRAEDLRDNALRLVQQT